MKFSSNLIFKNQCFRSYTSLFIIIISFSAISQEVSLKGKILDSAGVPLGSATVYLEKIADSSLIGYTISNSNGEFQLSEKTSEKKANLYISFTGFHTYQKPLDLKVETHLGNITLKIQENSLNHVW